MSLNFTLNNTDPIYNTLVDRIMHATQDAATGIKRYPAQAYDQLKVDLEEAKKMVPALKGLSEKDLKLKVMKDVLAKLVLQKQSEENNKTVLLVLQQFKAMGAPIRGRDLVPLLQSTYTTKNKELRKQILEFSLISGVETRSSLKLIALWKNTHMLDTQGLVKSDFFHKVESYAKKNPYLIKKLLGGFVAESINGNKIDNEKNQIAIMFIESIARLNKKILEKLKIDLTTVNTATQYALEHGNVDLCTALIKLGANKGALYEQLNSKNEVVRKTVNSLLKHKVIHANHATQGAINQVSYAEIEAIQKNRKR